MTTRVSKKQKQEPENPVDVEEDIISTLPNEILHRILSSSNTIEVVKTSVLSTRWRNLWKSHPFIQFSKLPLVHNSKKTLNCVDHVLRLRDSNTSNIQKLAMECMEVVDWNIFQQCIVSAVNQGAEEVDIMVWHSNRKHSIELNPSIFTSGVVRVFKLADFHQKSSSMIWFPRSIAYATHLRFLKLFRVNLPLGDSNQELHLSCPNLEKLIFINCDHSHLRVLDIATSQLSNLVISNSSVAYVDVGNCKLEIHTPKLSSFKFNGCSYLDYSFMDNFPLLDSVDVTINEVWVNQDSIIKLLNGFSNAKKLTLKGIARIFSGKIRHFSPFTSLKNLKLISVAHDNCNIQELVHFLVNSCGLVESFEWEMEGWSEWFYRGKYLMIPKIKLGCLKFVKVGALLGHRNELEFLKFLAKSVIVLEEIIITTRDNQSQFIEALKELPWSSPSAKLSLKLL